MLVNDKVNTGMTNKEIENLKIFREVKSELDELRELKKDVEKSNEFTDEQKKIILQKINMRMLNLARLTQGKKVIGE